ncbi:hypothetical protein OG413_41005 [Streptomyces sp. NBC_01433]|uniref:hypothetical protein n=1 Tax=Streptomyces sp. NBC_01433 TaxID=2903864 RepID=UPI00224CBC91|nr:hypothetical protein [Streptomyces sp. NBC_01433]MCX4681583.1 hypothetical protein [Streptomyces sp. NBC_01433]
MSAEHSGRSQKNPSLAKQVIAPRLVIDPDLSANLRRRIQQTEPSVLRHAESVGGPSPWQALLAPLSTKTGCGLLLYSTYLVFAPDARRYAELTLKALLDGVGAPGMWSDWTIAPALLAAWSLSQVMHRFQQRAESRQLRAARAHFVITDGLGERARTLIGRADHALCTAQQAVSSGDDSVERDRIEGLGRELWEITVALRDLNEFPTSAPRQQQTPRLDRRRGRPDAEGQASVANGPALMPGRSQDLEEVWGAIERRVSALVTVCEEAVALNREFGELRRPVEPDPENDALLDLRASTARHALAQTNLEALSAELSATRRAFRAADRISLQPEPSPDEQDRTGNY